MFSSARCPSGGTTETGGALVPRPLDGCPGVAGGHEVGVLPRAGVHGPAGLVQVTVRASREGVVTVGGGHAVRPADGHHVCEGGGGGDFVAGGELHTTRVLTQPVHWDSESEVKSLEEG